MASENDIPYRYHFDSFDKNRRCADYTLLQYGELWCKGQTVIPDHRQICFELTVGVGGRGIVTAGDETYEIGENQCVLSFPEENHSIRSDARAPLRFLFLGVNPAEDSPVAQAVFRALAERFRAGVRRVTLQDPYPRFVRIFTEMKSENPLYRELVGCLVSELLIDCLRQDSPAVAPSARVTDEAVLVYGVREYLQKNRRNPESLKALEGVFHYRYSYLARVFEKHTGKKLKTYFNELRMKEAESLLSDGFSVTKVGEELNFASVHGFSRCYKATCGICPSEVKKRSATAGKR